MPPCATCGSYLSREYLRVCGDNDDAVDECPHCAATQRSEARRTAAATSNSEGSDASKLVLTAESKPDEGRSGDDRRTDKPASGDPGSLVGTSRGRSDDRGGVAVTGSSGGRRGKRDTILASVLDAIR